MIRRTLLLFLLASQNSQTTFDFHSSFWVNLHHTLYNQAFVQRVGRAPDLSVLNPTEVAAWNEVVAYYGESVINHDFLESDMGRINAALARARKATSLGTPHEITNALVAGSRSQKPRMDCGGHAAGREA